MQIELLNENALRAWCQRIDIPAPGMDALLEVSRKIRADDALLGVFTSFYEQTSLRGAWHRGWEALEIDPLVEAKFGQQAALFYLLAYLAALPQAEREYQRRGISLDIFDATMRDITFYYVQDSDVRGFWTYTQFPWIWRHLSCNLFRLGRLQYMLIDFADGVTALRNKTNGEVLLLADPQIDLRPDGHADGAGGQPSDEPSWTPTFTANETGWQGYLISPYGYAQNEPATLSCNDWDVALQRGDTVLDMHIPRGSSLTTEECRQSLRQAYDFFAQFAPERKIKAAYCHSWFFTPQLQTLLGADSGIVGFQREFYLYPFAGGPQFLWNFVFGGKYPDRATAPRDTRLRRAVLDWLDNGGELFDLPGVMFHGPEEWGSQPYMTHWDHCHQRD